VTGATQVRLHPLRVREDGGSWVIGRAEIGEFIAAPPAAHRVITLLRDGRSVDQVRAALRAETGIDLDVAGFVTALVDLDFVAELDGSPLPQAAPPRPTLLRLRPEHVRWLLYPVTAVTAGAVILGAALAVVAEPALLPGYRDLLWSQSGGAIILGNAAIAWTIILLHELAHLATARGADVYGRMSFGTRLQFLAMQTDVTGIWAASRRTRMTVYLAGIALDLVIAALCLLILAFTPLAGLATDLVAATALLALMGIPIQCLVFMRTDLYFVLQDLTGCANLYADGSAYARYLARRLCGRLRRAGPPPQDPSYRLPTRERRAVRAYTMLLAIGTAACLMVAVTITLPVIVTLLGRAAIDLTNGGSAARVFDAAAVLTVTGTVQVLWARAWWKRHGHRVRGVSTHRSRRARRGGEVHGDHRDPNARQDRDDQDLR
jgi:hypothetical protein